MRSYVLVVFLVIGEVTCLQSHTELKLRTENNYTICFGHGLSTNVFYYFERAYRISSVVMLCT